MAVRNSILVLFTASSIILPPCFADAPAPSADSGSTPSTSSTAIGSSTPSDSASSSAVTKQQGGDTSRKPTTGLNPPIGSSSLQGNIQGGAPVVLQGLHDVGVTVHHLQEMLKGLMYEAQRQDMVVVAEPDVIGPIIMPAIPNPSGMLSMGYLPPRKKWVDYFMSQIEEIIPMLDHEINSLPRPDGTDAELQQAYIELFDAARGFNPPWSDLETATKGPEYKNADISTAGSGLWFQVEKFKKLKDKLFKLVKAETKQKKEKKS